MTDTNDEKADVKHPRSGRERWYKRPTVRTLKRQAETEDRDLSRDWDKRDNEQTRLPPSEEIHFGGVVLTEAFTPSTVSALYETLKRWPAESESRRQERLEGLARSRGGSRGGWQDLGVVRPAGQWVMGPGYNDADLPPGVDAVWLNVSYVTPALAMVVATFTLSEDSGDLSGLLRGDYESRAVDTQIRIPGRLGAVRARLPWSRPARYGVGYTMSRAEDEKRRACHDRIRQHERECSKWFFAKFPGRFARAKTEDRPIIRMLFTSEVIPYGDGHPWLRPVGLDFALPLWSSTDLKGWWLSEERWPYRDGRHAMTLAARRGDAARDPTDEETLESNWYLTQRVGSDHPPLAARHAITALLAIYADRLGELRDEAGVRRFPRRLIKEGRRLDDYLTGDGLDAATITSDLQVLTEDLTIFRWDVPEFTEHREHLGKAPTKREPMELIPSLRDAIRDQADRLASDTTLTTGNLRASAELRQAIANTRLQRFLLVLTFAAAIIAVVSILVTSSGH